MKMKRRALTLLLTIAMLLTFVPTMAFAGSADEEADDNPTEYADEYDFGELDEDCDAINLGESKTVNIDDENKVATFAFTPSVSGCYIFRSYSNMSSDEEGGPDPVGRVVYKDDEGNVVEHEIADDSFDDDNSYDFQIAFDAEGGKTYYLQAINLNAETASFEIKVFENKARGIDYVLSDPDEIPTLCEGVNMIGEDNDIYDYDASDLVEPGDKVYVFYVDGITKDDLAGKTEGVDYDVYTADEELNFTNSEGEMLSYDFLDAQDEDRWVPRDEAYPITFYSMGFYDTDTLRVKIEANPIKHFSFTPAYSDDKETIVLYAKDIYDEETGAYDLGKRGWYDAENEVYEGFVNGDVISVVFKDGFDYEDADYVYDSSRHDFFCGDEQLPIDGAIYYQNEYIYSDDYYNGMLCENGVYIHYAGQELFVDVKVLDGKHSHDWDAGVVVKQPSTIEAGSRLYTCRYCGETKNEAIAMLPSAPAKPVVQDLKAVKGLKLTKGKGKLTVKWKKADKKLKKTFQGYEIQYTLDGSFTDYAPKMVGKGKASAALKKLVKKKKYTVRIRRYRDDGSALHVSAWKTKRAKVK